MMFQDISRAFCTDIIGKGDFVSVTYENNSMRIVSKYNGEGLAGVSMNDVVDIDLTVDFPKYDEVQRGGMINILNRGEVVLQIRGEDNPDLNTALYLTKKGRASTKQKKGRPYIGRTRSSKDEDGYAKVSLNI